MAELLGIKSDCRTSVSVRDFFGTFADGSTHFTNGTLPFHGNYLNSFHISSECKCFHAKIFIDEMPQWNVNYFREAWYRSHHSHSDFLIMFPPFTQSVTSVYSIRFQDALIWSIHKYHEYITFYTNCANLRMEFMNKN